MGSILFVTGASLATNPRCVKEIQLAVSEGKRVMVVACKLGGWSQANETVIQQSLGDKVEIKYVDVTRSNKINWLISSVIEKLCSFLFKNFKNTALSITSYAFSKRSYLLISELRRISWSPSLVVAHNPASFYPAYTFARKSNALLAIDVEDYHPGENQPSSKREMVTLMMKEVMPLASYLSFASTLIKDATEKLTKLTLNKRVVINNSFPKNTFVFRGETNKKMSLVWFSQNINEGRGLELIVPAIYEKRNDLQLVLIGSLNQTFYSNFLSRYKDCLIIKQPMTQAELNLAVCYFDIGLAIEPGKDRNNLIALSNKIWTYYQGGLFILATDTPAQVSFIYDRPEHGIVVKRSEESIALALSDILKNRQSILSSKQDRFFKAQNDSWEEESSQLTRIWSEVMVSER